MHRLQILAELWYFLRDRKRWWLVPVVGALMLLGGLLIVGQSATALPFLYPLF